MHQNDLLVHLQLNVCAICNSWIKLNYISIADKENILKRVCAILRYISMQNRWSWLQTICHKYYHENISFSQKYKWETFDISKSKNKSKKIMKIYYMLDNTASKCLTISYSITRYNTTLQSKSIIPPNFAMNTLSI